jgi:hypothetical protein
MAKLLRLGIKTVPVVSRGEEYVQGLVLRDVADFVGIEYSGTPELSPGELVGRVDIILAALARFTRQLPDDQLATLLPDRERTYRDLVHHIARIHEVFVEAAEGAEVTYDALISPPPESRQTTEQIALYTDDVRQRLKSWWANCRDRSCEASVTTYYGPQTQHEFLERCTWHSGQHVRQLMMILGKLGIEPRQPLTTAAFAGLPMPEKVWDDETQATAAGAS